MSSFNRENIHKTVNKCIEKLMQNNNGNVKICFDDIANMIHSYSDINIKMKLMSGHSDKYRFLIFNESEKEIGIYTYK